MTENQVADLVIKEYTDEYKALDALLAGNVDAVLISESTGIEAITNGAPILGLDPVAFTGYAGLSISKEYGGDAKSLVQKLDGIILQMHANGELTNISQTFLGKDITRDAASFDITTLNQFTG